MNIRELTSKPGFFDLSDDAKMIVMQKQLDGFSDLSLDAQKIVLGKLTPDGKEESVASPSIFDRINNKYGTPVISQDTPDVTGQNLFKQIGGQVHGNLPVAGAVGGGILGGLGGGPLGALIGAPLGAGIGQSIKDLTSESPPQTIIDSVKSVLPEAQSALEGELIGVPAGVVAGKVLAPVANAAVKGADWMARNLPPFKNLTSFLVQRANKWNSALFGAREELIQKGMGLPDPNIPMKDMTEAQKIKFGQFMEEAGGKEATVPFLPPKSRFLDPENALVKQIFPEGAITEGIADSSFMRTIEANRGLIEGDKALSNLDAVKKILKGENPTVGDVNDLRMGIWGNIQGSKVKYGKLTPGQIETRGQLLTALEEDFAALDAMRGTDVLTKYKEAVQSSLDKRQLVKSQMLEGLLNRATKYNESTKTWEFHPVEFERIFTSNKAKLSRNFSDQEMNSLKDFVKQTFDLAADMPTTNASATMGLLGGSGLYGATSLPTLGQAALAVPAGFATFASFSLANPKGLMMQWTKERIKPGDMKLLKDAIKTEYMKFQEQE